jgi:hypothetical protein
MLVMDGRGFWTFWLDRSLAYTRSCLARAQACAPEEAWICLVTVYGSL